MNALDIDNKSLRTLEKLIIGAEGGNEDCIKLLRMFVSEASRAAPPDDLIKIAEFIKGFLVRHIQAVESIDAKDESCGFLDGLD
jgi:hypothetical protein